MRQEGGWEKVERKLVRRMSSSSCDVGMCWMGVWLSGFWCRGEVEGMNVRPMCLSLEGRDEAELGMNVRSMCLGLEGRDEAGVQKVWI